MYSKYRFSLSTSMNKLVNVRVYPKVMDLISTGRREQRARSTREQPNLQPHEYIHLQGIRLILFWKHASVYAAEMPEAVYSELFISSTVTLMTIASLEGLGRPILQPPARIFEVKQFCRWFYVGVVETASSSTTEDFHRKVHG